MDTIFKFMAKCPVIGRRTNPNIAAVVGLLFGGIGLAVYFRSFIDLLVPVGIAIVLILLLQSDIGVLGGMLVAAFWGYFRSEESNERLSASLSAAPSPQPGQ